MSWICRTSISVAEAVPYRMTIIGPRNDRLDVGPKKGAQGSNLNDILSPAPNSILWSWTLEVDPYGRNRSRRNGTALGQKWRRALRSPRISNRAGSAHSAYLSGRPAPSPGRPATARPPTYHSRQPARRPPVDRRPTLAEQLHDVAQSMFQDASRSAPGGPTFVEFGSDSVEIGVILVGSGPLLVEAGQVRGKFGKIPIHASLRAYVGRWRSSANEFGQPRPNSDKLCRCGAMLGRSWRISARGWPKTTGIWLSPRQFW